MNTEFEENCDGKCSAIKRDGEVSENLKKQAELLARMHDSITILNDKMSGILRESSPEEDSSKSPKKFLVPVASKIRDASEELYFAIKRIENITSRIEL